MASAPQADELLPFVQLRLVAGGDDVQLLPGSQYEHRNAVRAQARAAIFSSIRPRWLGDRNLATGLDSGQELFVGGGAVEQNRHPGRNAAARRSLSGSWNT